MSHSTSYIEISRSALEQNLGFIRRECGPTVRFSSVVKGNAYGHGIRPYTELALSLGVDHFSVFSSDEALAVKEVIQNEAELMIMGMIGLDELEWAIRHDVAFYVFEMKRLEKALELGRKLDISPRIHLEVDTGMNRTGFDKHELRTATELLKANEGNYVLEGFCTHYAGAESVANHTRVQRQYKQYNRAYNWITEQGITPQQRHTACSAASMTYPKTRMDMCRIGILQYGFWPSRETFINYLAKRKDKTDPLKRLISWKSKVMSTHHVRAGDFIGYGTTYMAEDDMRIATIPVGYSHGYSRSLSNTGRILIGGHRVGVVGLVNMNVMIVDITHLPDTVLEDEVVLIGKQDEMELSVASFGELSDQLNYELLTRLPMNIPRKIVD